MAELALPLVSHMVARIRERYHPPPTPHHLRKPGDLALVMRAGELAVPLISCSTLESRLCTSPGQHSKVDTGRRGHGKTGPEGMKELTVPLVCHVVAWARERCPLTPCHLWLAEELAPRPSEQESWSSSAAALGEAGPVAHLTGTVLKVGVAGEPALRVCAWESCSSPFLVCHASLL